MSEWLDAQRLRSLQLLLPTADERAAVEAHLAAGGKAADLARPERFFAATLRWPRFGARLEAACFRVCIRGAPE